VKPVHLGVYGDYGATMPACNQKRMPYEFSATDQWREVTCLRCKKSPAYANRWYVEKVRESIAKMVTP
jgi:hypothetical protein